MYYSGNNDEIYALSEEGLRIAKATESVLLLQIISNQIIQGMLQTPRWRAVDPLIFEIERFVEPASFQWAMLRRLQGIFFRRAGQPEAAIIALEDAFSFLQTADNKGLMALILHQLALAQHESATSRVAWTRYNEPSRLPRDIPTLRLCVPSMKRQRTC
ncbi:MAG: hypothetical protein WCB99_14745 [Candidatus Cybelea sp.]